MEISIFSESGFHRIKLPTELENHIYLLIGLHMRSLYSKKWSKILGILRKCMSALALEQFFSVGTKTRIHHLEGLSESLGRYPFQ